MTLSQLLIPALVTLSVGGVFYAVAYPFLSGDAQADKRRMAMQARTPAKIAARVNDGAKRKKQVSDSLKELDARNRGKKLTFETRMAQAGLSWSKKNFYIGSAIAGFFAAALAYVIGGNPIIAVALAVIIGIGIPKWLINNRRNRRLKKFLNEFPQAIDMIVRGIKAGIPLGDCIRNISIEAQEPVKTEFRMIVEAQTMGLTIPEAVERLIDRVPAAEANFFSIVINIQAKAGGNLAEALANLSNVLRDRKKMKGKIKAMSSEAKASAGIIGCLPPLVSTFVYITSPDYMGLLFTTGTGRMVLAGCACWMMTGIFVMKKMINFDI